MAKPKCYNRPAYRAGRWVKDGEKRIGKPHIRWMPHRMSTGCMCQTEVEYLGGDCRGCVWAS